LSKFTVQKPVIHIPSFNEYRMTRYELRVYLKDLDIDVPMDMLDSWYYCSDLEGWGKILYDLAFSSNLYKPNRFDCSNYALKAMNECAERYGINTLAMIVGDIPQGRHGFNLFPYWDFGEIKFMLWEPNEGFSWSGQPFEIGENGYVPDVVLI